MSNISTARPRYAGSASGWGFAIYRASHHDYEDSYLPKGGMAAQPMAPVTRPRPLPVTPPPETATPTNSRA